MKKNKPSSTALLILKAILFVSYDKQYAEMIPGESTRLSLIFVQSLFKYPGLLRFAIKNKQCRAVIAWFERRTNPGFFLHVAARKQCIEQLSREAIEHGVSQIIILGAGYDTLGFRIAATESAITCIEIDHPDTAKHKCAALQSIKKPENLYWLNANLRQQSIKEVLQQCSIFDPTKMTLVIIEGVLMYLREDDVKKLFVNLSMLTSNELACIFTFMNKEKGMPIQFKTAHPFVNRWIQVIKEPFLWGIARADLSAWIKPLGFEQIAVWGHEELAEKMAGNPLLAQGELICLMRKCL